MLLFDDSEQDDYTNSENLAYTVDFVEQPTRRLPIYLILDISASMYGAPITAVKEGIKLLYDQLNEMPFARKTVWISMITFGTIALERIKLTPLHEFEAVDLQAGGITSLGSAFDLLEKSIDRDVRVSLEAEKSDWLPLVYLFTDGDPTDDWEPSINRLKSRAKKTVGTIIMFACGDDIDENMLKRISPHVVRMDKINLDYLKNSLKWISQPIEGANPNIGDEGI